MQIHEIKANNTKSKKRVGRGGKRGTYSGRGVKGQKSRAGRKMPPAIRELIKRYPKLRGYSFSSLTETSSINLNVIDKLFEKGEEVTVKSLTKKGLIKKDSKPKILGVGDIKNPVTVRGCLVSKTAKEKIEKAGGKVEKTQNTTNNKQQTKKTQNTNYLPTAGRQKIN